MFSHGKIRTPIIFQNYKDFNFTYVDRDGVMCGFSLNPKITANQNFQQMFLENKMNHETMTPQCQAALLFHKSFKAGCEKKSSYFLKAIIITTQL